MRRIHFVVLALTVALAAAIVAAAADKLQLIIGQPFAVLGSQPATASPTTKITKGAAMAVRADGCTDPAALHLSAAGEGLVGGARRTVPLTVVPVTNPPAFTVSRPMEPGAWVVTLQATCGKLTAGAIVPLTANGIDRERSTFYDRAATAADIEKAVKANGAEAATAHQP